MKLVGGFRVARGTSLADCHFVAGRWDEHKGWDVDMSESWVAQRVGGELHVLRSEVAWYTDLWRSPSGLLFVADADQYVHINRSIDPRQPVWESHPIPAVLTGVWGLDDSLVFAWGSIGQDRLMFRWDGHRWDQVESPGHVVAMHGVSRDLVYAVGPEGLVAHYDGGPWSVLAPPTQSVLCCVLVVSANEIYVAGHSGELFEGSAHGFSGGIAGTGGLYDLARWRGSVWGARRSAGLVRLDGAKLVECEDELLRPARLDANERLLVTCENLLAESSDGETFDAWWIDEVMAAIDHVRPMWRRGTP